MRCWSSSWRPAKLFSHLLAQAQPSQAGITAAAEPTTKSATWIHLQVVLAQPTAERDDQ